jgi:hypothetical protein
VKLADKPGSVVDSHSSRRFVTLRSSNLPADDASNAIVSLFDLAPNGVYRATPVTGSAVRSYRTGSPLPDLFAQPSAVYFLWHCSSPHGVRPLTGILLCGARTFLPAEGRREKSGFPHTLVSASLARANDVYTASARFRERLVLPAFACAATV